MTFYNRPSTKYPKTGLLWYRLNGKRFSTGLEDTPKNRKKFTNYHKDDEFLEKHNVSNKRVLFVELLNEALEEKEKTVKYNSYINYLSAYNKYTLPYFQNIYVQDIKPLLIKRFYNNFSNSSSLTNALVIIHDAFENAILNEYVKYNPTRDIKKPKFDTQYEPNPFTLEEMSKLINLDSYFSNLYAIAFYTGLRIGELISLKWSDIDFNKNTIDVNKTRVNGIDGTAKTKKSNSVIDLPFEAKEFFNKQRQKTGLREYIFYSQKNELIKNSVYVTYWFSKDLVTLGFKHRGIHQIRHSFASIKLSLGERIEWVSFMLRHETLSMTRDIYYKWIPDEKEERVIVRLDDTKKAQNF